MALLPKEPQTKGPFIGPGEHMERRSSTGRISHSTIAGDVDFIFGGVMFFLNTETLNLMIKGRRRELHLILCTRKDEIRFIFNQSRFISDSGRKMTYLGELGEIRRGSLRRM